MRWNGSVIIGSTPFVVRWDSAIANLLFPSVQLLAVTAGDISGIIIFSLAGIAPKVFNQIKELDDRVGSPFPANSRANVKLGPNEFKYFRGVVPTQYSTGKQQNYSLFNLFFTIWVD